MANTDYLSPTTGSQSGSGGTAWTNPSNIKISNNTYSYATVNTNV